jgi:hypothetical protein
MNPPDDLREEYHNVEAVLPETVMLADGCRTYHLAGRGGEGVFCATESSNWGRIETDDALRLSLEPCRYCFLSLFEHYSRQPDSPVEHTETTQPLGEIDANTVTAEEIAPDGGVEAQAKAITSRPEEVLVATNSTKDVYHAPTADGPLCGNDGGYRRVERVTLAGHAEPCRECFEVDEIDTSTP